MASSSSRSPRPSLSALALPLALLLSLTLLPAPLCAASAPQDPRDRGSLEDLLRRVKSARESRVAGLTEDVQRIVEALENLPERNREREHKRLRDELHGMGPGIVPLLVPHLDPTDDEGGVSRARQVRAETVAEVIAEMASPAATDELLAATQTGSLSSRIFALRALWTSPEPNRVAPAIEVLYRRAEGDLQTAALETLARLGGEESRRLLSEALVDDDARLAGVALRSLGKVGSKDTAEIVLGVLRSERARQLVSPLLEYYASLPELLEESEHVLALVELAGVRGLSRGDKVAVLELLRETEDLKLDRDVRKAVEPLKSSFHKDVGEAALALLARHGDRAAKRDLLEPYDARCKRQPDWPSVFIERGDINYMIGDLGDAIKDYRTALRNQITTRRDATPYVGLARCFALQGRFKEANDYLLEAPLSLNQRRALADDPAFAEMLESKYADLFGRGD